MNPLKKNKLNKNIDFGKYYLKDENIKGRRIFLKIRLVLQLHKKK